MEVDSTSHASQTRMAIAVCGCGHDGRLGLSNNNSSTHQLTLLELNLDSTSSSLEILNDKLIIKVGGYHNFAITSAGVYGWGLNENGQLGLGCGAPAAVTTPTRISFFDNCGIINDIVCGAYHTFAWTSEGLFACGKNEEGQLGLQEDGDHFSFTKVLTSSQIYNNGNNNNNSNTTSSKEIDEGYYSFIQSGELTHVSCGTHHTLLAFRNILLKKEEQGEENNNNNKEHEYRFPLLILATGKGDFGELGYDGDVWSILKTKAKTMQTFLKAEVQKQQPKDQEKEVYENNSGLISQTLPEKKWKPLKQRRAVFSSMKFQPVKFPFLFEQITKFSEIFPLEIISLHAMHLHSAVVLGNKSLEDDKKKELGTISTKTFHWGCYYCNNVEDDTSSIPREAGENVCIHAGNEILFRYSTSISYLSVKLEVLGSGIIGLGEEDSFIPEWTPLKLPPEAEGYQIRSISGREHFLILLDNKIVVGFGDNMHGQLGIDNKKEQDSILNPTVILKVGDCISANPTKDSMISNWEVKSINDALCGVRHSVFLLEVKPKINETATI